MGLEIESERYRTRRAWVQEHFDRGAAAAWAQLTSDARVGWVRTRVRAAREQMRATIGAWLPADLTGQRVLDAGCGTGPLSLELARRGAQVVAVDLAGRLVAVARERTPPELAGSIDFRIGDMLDEALGTFDHVVAMDSLIHYAVEDVVGALGALAPRVRRSLLFTFVPHTALFGVARALARVLPRGQGPPAVEPVSEAVVRASLAAEPRLASWRLTCTARVSGAFYRSQAVQLLRGVPASQDPLDGVHWRNAPG